MGYINQNTNQFKVYLTKKGKELLTTNGLISDIAYFSLSDDDANYGVFNDFDPNDIEYQDIVVVENRARPTNGLSTIFMQPSLDGHDNNVLFNVNISDIGNQIIYNNDNEEEKTLLTYKNTNSYRSYKLVDNNGLYLRSQYPVGIDDYNRLNKDYDFYPTLPREKTLFTMSNSTFFDASGSKVDGFIGSNSKETSNNNEPKSVINKNRSLVLHERYYTEFYTYFNLNGGQNYADNSADYDLNVNFYASLGTNKVQLKLDSLLIYNTGTLVYDVIPTGLTSSVYISGDTLYLKYKNANGFFENNRNPSIGYNFKIRCRLLNDISGFTTDENVVLDNKDMKISVEYSKLSDSRLVSNNTTVVVTNPDGNSGEPPVIPDPD